jgi:hypothetical protein
MSEVFQGLHEGFTQEDKLKQVCHPWDTNICEGFNKLIRIVLPKYHAYCKEIDNSVIIHNLALCTLSIG